MMGSFWKEEVSHRHLLGDMPLCRSHSAQQNSRRCKRGCVVNNIYYWFPVSGWRLHRWMGRDWSNYRLTVCQQIEEMCCAGFGSYKLGDSLSLRLSAQYVRQKKSVWKYIFPGCACRFFGIFSLFAVAGLWVWVPGGWRWEDMGFGKFLRSLLHVFPNFF